MAVDLNLQVGEVGLCAFELVLCIQHVALQLRITQFQDNRTGVHDGAGAQNNSFDSHIRLRGNPADVFGHQGSEPVDFAQHRSALHFVGPDGRPVHCRRRGAQAGEPVAHTANKEECHRAVDNPADFLCTCVGRSLNVHNVMPISWNANTMPKVPFPKSHNTKELAGFHKKSSVPITR